MIRRILYAAAACALLVGAAQVVAPQVAVAQASLQGQWRGDNSGNIVEVIPRQGGIEVVRISNNANQRAESMFLALQSDGSYVNSSAQGTATIRPEGGNLRMSTNTGWSDLFRPYNRSSAAAPTTTVRPPAPAAAPVSPGLEPNIFEALKAADEAARDELAEALEDEEPPQPEKPAEKPQTPEAIYVMRESANDEANCVEPTFVGPRNAGGTTWTFDVQLENDCGYDVLVRIDTAERNVGETAWRNYSPNGGLLLNVGEQNTPWQGAVPASLIGFTPFKPAGEGFVWRQRPPKSLTVRSGEPRKEIGIWIVVCRLTDPTTQQRSFLFVEKERLQDKPRWRCVKGLDRPAVTGS